MWTCEQQNAIDAPVSNMLVTAGAGSGKTAVMVERIIKRVTGDNPTDIDKILIVTYTNAAAAEVRERITAALLAKLDVCPDNKSLQRQLSLINKANICTIHSFCLGIIRANFNSIGLDPDFKIGDDTEISLLKTQALDEIFDEAYEKDDIDFLNLVNSYTKKNDSALMGMVQDLYNFSMSMPNPEKWLDMAFEAYKSPKSNLCIEYMLSRAENQIEYALETYDEAIKICGEKPDFKVFKEFLINEQNDISSIKYSLKKGWNDAYILVNEQKFQRRPSIKTEDVFAADKVKNLRETAKNVIKSLKEEILTTTTHSLEEDFRYLLPSVCKLIELTKAYKNRFDNLKRKKNIVDFNDFEHFALKILQNDDGEKSDVAMSLSADFDEIYVDEYQDCNNVQETIFKLVSTQDAGKPNIFMVGDVKQSIYKFRDANPGIFMDKEHSYEDYNPKSIALCNKIQLNKNFRSRKTVLDGVNFIFSQIMSSEIGEIDYTEKDFLRCGASYENTTEYTDDIDVVLIENDKGANDEDISNIEAEANYISTEIEKLISRDDMTVFDKKINGYRKLMYSDIVILLRSTKGKADVFEHSLSKKGIPVYCDVGGGYFDASEIREIIAILKIICNPLDDINLVSVMRSALYNIDDNELASIRLTERDDYFYNAAKKYCTENQDKTAYKLNRLFSDLRRFSEYSKFMNVDEFIWFVINETNYLSYISTLKNFEQKKANIRIFTEQAKRFEMGSYKGLYNFISYIDNVQAKGGDMDSAKIIGENENVVRIMSIHKSKGLEFPVVFLAMCNKKFNYTDSYGSMILHKELGIGIDYVDHVKRFSYPLITKNAIKSKIKIESLSEEQRVLYVALTRAREKLIITGVVNNAYAYLDKIAESVSTKNELKLSPNITETAKSYMDWVIQAIIRHKNLKGFSIDTPLHVIDDCSSFRLSVAYAGLTGEDMNSAESDFSIEDTSVHASEIKRRLEYSYEYADIKSVPTNVTVTEVKRLLSEDNNDYMLYSKNDLSIPCFMQNDTELPKNKIGTLIHLAMQKIHLTHATNKDKIKEDICTLVSNDYITQEEAEYIDADKILLFFKSALGRQILESERVCREYSFKVLIGANDIFDTVHTGENLVVQGTIDLFFCDENGDIVLVDYKTDKVKTTAQDIADKYKMQIKYYKIALEKLTGKKVAKSYIYLFDTNDFIEC